MSISKFSHRNYQWLCHSSSKIPGDEIGIMIHEKHFVSIFQVYFSHVKNFDSDVSTRFFSLQEILLLEGKWKLLTGILRNPNGKNSDIFLFTRVSVINYIHISNICKTRHSFEFTATNRISGKNLWVEIFEPKFRKNRLFLSFFFLSL